MMDMIYSLAAEQKRHRMGQPVEIERPIRRQKGTGGHMVPHLHCPQGLCILPCLELCCYHAQNFLPGPFTWRAFSYHSGLTQRIPPLFLGSWKIQEIKQRWSLTWNRSQSCGWDTPVIIMEVKEEESTGNGADGQSDVGLLSCSFLPDQQIQEPL